MKKLIKKILNYDKIYHALKSSFLYQARKKLNGQIANTMYGNPSKDFFVIGVTGTNGKTTTVNLIHKILNEKVAKTMMISTANIKIGNQELKNEKKMTSLDIFDLQSTLAIAKDSGCKIAVLETSSHGLDQYRFEGVEFDVAVLTNITHDHLDYHLTMNEYAKAKKKLFSYVLNNHKRNKIGIFPADDSQGRKRFDDMPFEKKINYSIHSSAMMKAEDIQEGADGTIFTLSYLGKQYKVQSKLVGKFNVYNILAALGVAGEMGIPMQQAIDTLQDFTGVAGRMEKVEHKQATYYVDFAHTPDALQKALDHLQTIKQTRIITMFGAPGNRDKDKRPIMAEIADKNSDIVIITDDDPDTENRGSIIKELISGIKTKELGKNLFVLPERTEAMKFAIQIAQAGDLILLAGKGHETIQLTNHGKRPRNDKTKLLEFLNT